MPLLGRRRRWNPIETPDYAAGMLSGLLTRYGGDVHAALSAYNAGSPKADGTRTDRGDGRPLGYADSVLQHYARLTGGSPGTGSAAPLDPPQAGAPDPEANASQSILAELASLIASLGALESPLLRPPSPPQMPQSYQPQVIDYAGLLDNERDN